MAKFKQSNKRNPTVAESQLQHSFSRGIMSLAVCDYDETKDKSIFYRIDINPAEMLKTKEFIERMMAQYPDEFAS